MNQSKDKDYFTLIILTVLVIVLLSLTVNTSMPYEQDEGSKAAKIIYLVSTNNMLQPLDGCDIYFDIFNSFYYMISSIIYKFIGGNIFYFLNIQALIMGVICFFLMLILLRRAYDIPYLYSFIIFVSMPILIITYIYGNEVSYSFTFFVASLTWFSIFNRWRYSVSSVLLAAATFSRPDVVLLWPFWFLWVGSEEGKNIHQRIFFRNILYAAGYLSFFCLLYWIIFIGKIPKYDLSFDLGFNIKLFLGYLTYPFCLPLVIVGLIGHFTLLKNNLKLFFINSLLLLPLLFYYKNLSSPKYVISLCLFFGISTAILLDKLNLKLKLVVFCSILVWWFISITPFGVNAFNNGSYWVLPTADGPVPTGSYFWFYNNVRNGLYQQKYKNEINLLEKAVKYICDGKEKNTVLYGYFNRHFLLYNLANLGYNSYIENDSFPIIDIDKELSDYNDKHLVMINYSYLNLNKLPHANKNLIEGWLLQGHLKPVIYEDDLFPDIIEIGNSVPISTNIDLSKRILFVNNYYGNCDVYLSYNYIYCNKPLCWTSISDKITSRNNSIYVDSNYQCFDGFVPKSIITSTPMPSVYYKERDPRGLIKK